MTNSIYDTYFPTTNLYVRVTHPLGSMIFEGQHNSADFTFQEFLKWLKKTPSREDLRKFKDTRGRDPKLVSDYLSMPCFEGFTVEVRGLDGWAVMD